MNPIERTEQVGVVGQILSDIPIGSQSWVLVREDVFAEIEASYSALVDRDDADGLTALERACVALRVAAIHRHRRLALWFLDIVDDHDLDVNLARRIGQDATIHSDEAPGRIALLVNYATQLTIEPRMVSPHRFLDVAERLSAAEVVALSELISFLTYFVRLLAGLEGLLGEDAT